MLRGTRATGPFSDGYGLVPCRRDPVRVERERQRVNRHVPLRQKYQDAIARATSAQTGGLELLPMLMAQACVEVLPVEGASITVTDDLRVPLGASDPDAAVVERLQVTLGDGPCLSAMADGQPVSAGLSEIKRRWPVFHQEFVARTSFRSVASVLLGSHDRRPYGALDLYSTSEEPLEPAVITEVVTDVAASIGTVLFDSPAVPDLTWIDTTQAVRRMNVWIAVGILIEHVAVDSVDALALLRGYSYSHSQSLDQTATQLADRQLQLSTLFT